jgi:hypothetical protein
LVPLLVAMGLQGMILWVPVEKLFMSEIGFTLASVGVMAAAYAAVVPLLDVPSRGPVEPQPYHGVGLCRAAGQLDDRGGSAATVLRRGLLGSPPTGGEWCPSSRRRFGTRASETMTTGAAAARTWLISPAGSARRCRTGWRSCDLPHGSGRCGDGRGGAGREVGPASIAGYARSGGTVFIPSAAGWR